MGPVCTRKAEFLTPSCDARVFPETMERCPALSRANENRERKKPWQEHGLKPLVGLIAGQELGSKREHLALGAVGRYEPHKILMVGDAPGDLQAAESNGILFYPIDPGFEDESWQRFFEEGLPKFLSENYVGAYMTAQIARFQRLLPDTPPWQGR